MALRHLDSRNSSLTSKAVNLKSLLLVTMIGLSIANGMRGSSSEIASAFSTTGYSVRAIALACSVQNKSSLKRFVQYFPDVLLDLK